LVAVARIDYFNDPTAPKANSVVPSVTAVVVDDAGRLLMVHQQRDEGSPLRRRRRPGRVEHPPVHATADRPLPRTPNGALDRLSRRQPRRSAIHRSRQLRPRACDRTLHDRTASQLRRRHQQIPLRRIDRSRDLTGLGSDLLDVPPPIPKRSEQTARQPLTLV
jgi:hypothetical protein